MFEALEFVKIQLDGRRSSERGASAVEYGLLVALIGVIIIVAVALLGHTLSSIFNKTAASISAAS